MHNDIRYLWRTCKAPFRLIVSIKTPNLQTTLTTNDLICSRFHNTHVLSLQSLFSNTGVWATSQQTLPNISIELNKKCHHFYNSVSVILIKHITVLNYLLIHLHLFQSYVLWASRYQMPSESTTLLLSNVRALKKLCCVCFMCVWAQKPCMYVCRYHKFVVYVFLVTRLSVFLPKMTSPTLL